MIIYTWEIIGLFCCYLLDFVLTYINTTRFKVLAPNAKAESYELNALVKYMWKKFGIKKGTIFANLIIMPLVILLLYIFRGDINVLMFWFGIYAIIIYIHISNFISLFFYREPLVPPIKEESKPKDGT